MKLTARLLDPADRLAMESVRALVAEAERADGTAPFSDQALLAASSAVLATLARIDSAQLNIVAVLPTPPEQAAQVVVGDGLMAYLPLAGMVDLDKERERLEKQLAEAEDEVKRLTARLSNAGFVDNAPANIVAGAREQLAGAQERLARLQERLATNDHEA